MKRATFLILTGLFASMFLGSLSFARGVKEVEENDSKRYGGLPTGMEDKGNMGGRMTGMRPMENVMLQAMAIRSVISTPDGGVIVVVGNKLVKYDKDLNVVKEAEIKIDMEAVRQNMMARMPTNPMTRENMMMNPGKAPGEAGSQPAGTLTDELERKARN